MPTNSAVPHVVLLKDPWLWPVAQQRPLSSLNSTAARGLFGLIVSPLCVECKQQWTRQCISHCASLPATCFCFLCLHLQLPRLSQVYPFSTQNSPLQKLISHLASRDNIKWISALVLHKLQSLEMVHGFSCK